MPVSWACTGVQAHAQPVSCVAGAPAAPPPDSDAAAGRARRATQARAARLPTRTLRLSGQARDDPCLSLSPSLLPSRLLLSIAGSSPSSLISQQPPLFPGATDWAGRNRAWRARPARARPSSPTSAAAFGAVRLAVPPALSGQAAARRRPSSWIIFEYSKYNSSDNKPRRRRW